MPVEGADYCGICEEKLPKEGDHAFCKGCGKGFHFGDCSVKTQTWKSMSKVMQETWNCQSCRKLKKRSDSVTSNQNQEEVCNLTSKDTSEVSSLGAILEKVNALPNIQSTLNTIENSITFLSSKYDMLLDEIKALREENSTLKKEVESLKKKTQERDQTIVKLENDVAEMDQYGRRCNLEVHGLKCNGDPRNEDIVETVRKLAASIQVPFDKDSIHRAHRLQQRRDGKPPTLLIQFFSRNDRDAWLKAGKKMQLEGLYFNENLCPFYRTLLRDTKEKARLHKFAFVWCQGGKVLVRKREGDRNVVVIRNRDDLNKLNP